jgi:Casein kinase II regulatory subunit
LTLSVLLVIGNVIWFNSCSVRIATEVDLAQHLLRSSTSSTLDLLYIATYRYIITNRGMHAMYEKYRTAAFGRCPQVFCQGQPVLPVGLSDLPRNYTVNVFCPRCHGLYFPKSTRQANIDGAYFGTTFPHLYLICHPVSIYHDMIGTSVYSHSYNWRLRYQGHDPIQANTSVSSPSVWFQGQRSKLILSE